MIKTTTLPQQLHVMCGKLSQAVPHTLVERACTQAAASYQDGFPLGRETKQLGCLGPLPFNIDRLPSNGVTGKQEAIWGEKPFHSVKSYTYPGSLRPQTLVG